MDTTPDTLKVSILAALDRFIRQRPGLEYCNYGDPQAYRAEMRRITRDLNHARVLLRRIEWSSIAGQELLDAARGGRLSIEATPDGGVKVDYCTGQYFPTEYRAAVARLCASALWDWTRENSMPEPEYKTHGTPAKSTRNPGYPDAPLHTVATYNGLSAGDWMRRHFRREFGRGLASRFFN